MINNYNEVHNDEDDQAIIQGIRPQNFPQYCLLFISALSTLLGGLLLFDLIENQKSESECKNIIITLKYYSQFLIIDGLAQIIICFILIFVLQYLRKYDSQKGLMRQLLFQFIDTGVFLIILSGIEMGLKDQKQCISFEGRIMIVIYSFWIYFLFFILLLARFDQ